MAAQYSSKHGVVGKSPAELFMAFTDLRNFKQMVPQDQKIDIEADYDTLKATVQGMSMGVRVSRRLPYSLIELQDNGAPFHFTMTMHFDDMGGCRTDFSIEVEADISGMIKMMVGGKVKEALDKIVDGIVAAAPAH